MSSKELDNKLSRQLYMDGAFPSKETIQKGMDSIFAPCDWYYRIEKEVRKEMAIDYMKVWKGFKAKYGKQYLVPTAGSCIAPTNTVANAMNTWIRNAILSRERLMNEYIHEHIATSIDGGDSKHHVVRLFNKRCKTTNALGAMSINKKDFDTWCKEKEKESESI